MEKHVKTIKLITAITFIVMFICIIVLTLQFIKIGNLKERNENLIEYKQELTNEINNYNSVNSYYDSNYSEYLENYAREVLGWGSKGETWYTKA